MTDIRDLAGPGKAVFDTAEKLQKANLIDDAQFKELTNDKVGPQDTAIANKALDAIQASTPGGMDLMMSIPTLNKNIAALQKQALEKSVAELAELKAGQPAKKPEDPAQNPIGNFMNAVGVSARGVRDFLDSIPDQRTIIQNIRH